MDRLAEVKLKVGGYACIKLGSHCTAQGKVSHIGANGQVTIDAGGKIITGPPITFFPFIH